MYLATAVGESLAEGKVAGLAWDLTLHGEVLRNHPDPKGSMRRALNLGKDRLHVFQLLTMRVMREDGSHPDIQQVQARFRMFSQDDGGTP